MSFRQYGGINYAARNNIVKNNYTNANNLSVMTKVGQPSSIINVESGLYGIAGDITFQTNNGIPKYGIMFSDGSFQNAAVTSTDSYWANFSPQTSPSTIYYTGRVIVGADPYVTGGSISSDVRLAINGATAMLGNLYVANGEANNAGVIYVTDNTDIANSNATLRIVADRTSGANYIQSGINDDTGSVADLYFTSINNNDQWMVIKADGKVGIGTTSPAYTLDVTGNLRVSSDALINGLTVGKGGGNLLANTVFGIDALKLNTSGINNVALGYQALYSDVNGSFNTAVGFEALYSNTSSSNTALGLKALRNNTTGSENVAIGRRALFCSNSSNPDSDTGNGIGNYNVAVGNFSLYMNQSGNNNTAIGYQALYSYNYTIDTTAPGNTAVGYQALYSNLSSRFCTAVGYQASYYQTGVSNTSLGFRALQGTSGANGTNNCAFGDSALQSNIGGYDNVSIGHYSLLYNTTGYNNTAVGSFAGANTSFGGQTNSRNCTFIGCRANTGGYNYINSTAIGYDSKITADNQIMMGTSTETVKIPGNLTLNHTLISEPSTNSYSITQPYYNFYTVDTYDSNNNDPITIFLPDPSVNNVGLFFTFRRINNDHTIRLKAASQGNVIVGHNINSTATYIDMPNNSVYSSTFLSDGSKWWCIGWVT